MDWLLPESFQPQQSQPQCWIDASTTGWGIMGPEGQAEPNKGRVLERYRTDSLDLVEALGLDVLEVRHQTLVVWSSNQVAISVFNALDRTFPIYNG